MKYFSHCECFKDKEIVEMERKKKELKFLIYPKVRDDS